MLATPVPESATLLVPPDALWAMLSVAERAPAAVGANVTLTVQVVATASVVVAVQVPPEIAKSPLPIVTADNCSGAPPVFERVTTFSGLVTPTVTEP